MADLGTINSLIDNYTGVVVGSFPESYITTNIQNYTVSNVGAIIPSLYTSVQVTKGEKESPSLLAPDKGNLFPQSSVPVSVTSIEFIIPGPIANIEYGFNLGKEQSTIKVPRVYPPIYIEPRSRNA